MLNPLEATKSQQCSDTIICHDPETDPGRAATEGEEKQTQAGLGESNTLFFFEEYAEANTIIHF